MARNRINVHPMGYVPIKRRTDEGAGRGLTLDHTQTVPIVTKYEVQFRDSKGNIVYTGKGKNRKPVTEEFYGLQYRTIKHFK